MKHAIAMRGVLFKIWMEWQSLLLTTHVRTRWRNLLLRSREFFIFQHGCLNQLLHSVTK
jgi:hypothetical protein